MMMLLSEHESADANKIKPVCNWVHCLFDVVVVMPRCWGCCELLLLLFLVPR